MDQEASILEIQSRKIRNVNKYKISEKVKSGAVH